jgi:hypothetical protein
MTEHWETGAVAHCLEGEMSEEEEGRMFVQNSWVAVRCGVRWAQ